MCLGGCLPSKETMELMKSKPYKQFRLPGPPPDPEEQRVSRIVNGRKIFKTIKAWRQFDSVKETLSAEIFESLEDDSPTTTETKEEETK